MLSPTLPCPDPDLDRVAAQLLADIRSQEGLRRYHLLCRLSHGQMGDVGSRRLHAIADQLSADASPGREVIDVLRFLAELNAIAVLGHSGAAASTDGRMRSETAKHFGHAVSVLRHAVRVCMRQLKW